MDNNQNTNQKCSLYSRRQFVASATAAAVFAACGNKTVSVFGQDKRTADTLATEAGRTGVMPAAPAGEFLSNPDRTLVVVEFGGGNDILNMIVPHGDDKYYDLRNSVAIGDPIDLDGEIGLHPELTALSDHWTAGSLAIVEGVGIENPDLSHFSSMRRWWDGTQTPDHTGWLGRYLDGTTGYDQLLAGITLGTNPSQAMLGKSSFVVNIADASGLGGNMPWWVDDRDEFMSSWAGFAPVDVPSAELTQVQRAIASTVEAGFSLREGLTPLENAIKEGEIEGGEGYTMTGQLRLAATLIASGIEPRVIYVHGYTDFDTHENQLSTHGRMMADFNQGVAIFSQILDEAGMSDRALIMTTSEFGRRPQENDGGTDHGTASSQLLISPLVEGGRYGTPHSLTDLDPEGNLKHNVDFRSVFATVLDDFLETNHEQVLRSEYETLPVFG